MGLHYCWGLDTSSDVEVYKIGVESRKRRSAISRACQHDVGVQEMPICQLALSRHVFARRFPCFFFPPDCHGFGVLHLQPSTITWVNTCPFSDFQEIALPFEEKDAWEADPWNLCGEK